MDPDSAVRADLHVHTALSPCGSDEMTPPAIVADRAGEGLDMIAVCDHNTRGQRRRRPAGGRSRRTAAWPCSPAWRSPRAEEVHVVGLFPDAAGRRERGRRVACPAAPRPTPATTRSSASSRCWRPTAAGMGAETAALAAGHPPRPQRGGGAHPQRRRAGRGGAHRPQVVQRVLPARLLPRGCRLRRAWRCRATWLRRFAAPGRVRGAAACPCRLVRQPLPGGDRQRPSPSSVWPSPPSPSWPSPSPEPGSRSVARA